MAGSNDLTGCVFGRLTVAGRSSYRDADSAWWDCVCSCGKRIRARGQNLRSGSTKSCGCLRSELLKKGKPFNLHRINGGIVYATLFSRGHKSYTLMFDEADFALLSKHRWSPMNTHTEARYACTSIDGKTFRITKLLFPDVPDGLVVDHINGNPLDNRRCNLRVCTQTENKRNQKVRKDSRSGLKGVASYGNKGRWKAGIVADGKFYHLGTFPTKELAYEAYCAAAEKHFGDFARAN